MISIVIPTLNEARYIGKLLNSLYNQTYKDFEIIIIDGGSKDKTQQIVQKYKNRGLRWFISKRGLTHSRNLGVKKSKHELILFLDADIILSEDFLNKGIMEIIQRKIDCAVPRFRPISRKWYDHLFWMLSNSVLWLTQFVKPMGPACCLFVKKKWHIKISGFKEEYGWGNDLNYVKRISKYGKFRVLNLDVNYSVRRFEKEGTKKTMKKFILAFWYTLINREDLIPRIEFKFGIF